MSTHGYRVAMTKLAEIQSAILQLNPAEREELIHWLVDGDETPEMLAAIDEADRSFEGEGGVAPAEVRRKLRSWITG